MIILRNTNDIPSSRGNFDPFPEEFFDDFYNWNNKSCLIL